MRSWTRLEYVRLYTFPHRMDIPHISGTLAWAIVVLLALALWRETRD